MQTESAQKEDHAMNNDQWLKLFVTNNNQTGGLITGFFSLSYEEQKTIKAGIFPGKCKYCNGTGIYEDYPIHYCNCEYCDRDGEPDYDGDPDLIDCKYCNATGKRLDPEKLEKAITILRLTMGDPINDDLPPI